MKTDAPRAHERCVYRLNDSVWLDACDLRLSWPQFTLAILAAIIRNFTHNSAAILRHHEITIQLLDTKIVSVNGH